MFPHIECFPFILLALCSFVVPQKGSGGQNHGGSLGAGSNLGGILGGGTSHGSSPGGGNKGSAGGSLFGGSGNSNPLGGFGGSGNSNPLGGFGGFGGNQQPKQGGSNQLGGLLGSNSPFSGGNNQPKPGNQGPDRSHTRPTVTQTRPTITQTLPTVTKTRPAFTQTRPTVTQTRPRDNNQPRPTGNWGGPPKGWTGPKKGNPGPPPPRPDDRPPWQGKPNEPHRGGDPHRGNDQGPWNYPRGGDRPYRTTIITGGPTIIKPTVTEWRDRGPRTVYNSWDNSWNFAPQIILPPLPRITLTFNAAPRPGCSLAPTTYWTSTETLATFTSTITQPPPDALITVYYDPTRNDYSTYYGDEIETVYEIYVFTTTAQLEVVSSTLACGLGWGWKEKRTMLPNGITERC